MLKTPLQAYKAWTALCLHFYESFDYHVFGPKVRIGPKTFEKKPEVPIYHSLLNVYGEHELEKFFISALSKKRSGKIDHVSQVFENEFKDRYTQQCKYMGSIPYWFAKDWQTMTLLLRDRGVTLRKVLYGHEVDKLPIIFQIEGTYIDTETILVLDRIFGFLDEMKECRHPAFASTLKRLQRYEMLFKASNESIEACQNLILQSVKDKAHDF